MQGSIGRAKKKQKRIRGAITYFIYMETFALSFDGICYLQKRFHFRLD